jgi:hypothetical protein
MKTAQELAENYLSSKDLKKRATALKRVAGGIKSESANASFLKLDAKELEVLQKASSILSTLASRYGEASKIEASKVENHNAKEKLIRAEMEKNFSAIATGSVAGKVVFIAAVSSFLLEGPTKQLRHINAFAEEALSSLAYQLAGKSGEPKELVAEAWTKFEGAQAGLETKHKELIEAIRRETLGITTPNQLI